MVLSLEVGNNQIKYILLSKLKHIDMQSEVTDLSVTY